MPTQRFYASLAVFADEVARCGFEMAQLLRHLDDRLPHLRAIDDLADRDELRLIVPAVGHDELLGPFHRADVLDLVRSLDAIIRTLQDAAQLAHVTGLDRSLTDVVRLGSLLADGTAELGGLIGRLLTATADEPGFDRIHALERDAREGYHDGLSILFSAAGDELQVIKEKEVLDRVVGALREVGTAAALTHRLLATRT